MSDLRKDVAVFGVVTMLVSYRGEAGALSPESATSVGENLVMVTYGFWALLSIAVGQASVAATGAFS